MPQFLASPPKKNEKEKNDVDVIPLEDRRFSIIERANNWIIELRKRDDNQTHDIVRPAYTNCFSKNIYINL